MNNSNTTQNSFIFDRNWYKVNPNNDTTVSIQQARQFLKLVIYEYQSLKQLTQNNIEEINQQQIQQKIQSFIFKYVQQKELSLASNRQLPTLQKSPYRLNLNECMQIWRWLSQDSVSYKSKDINNYDDSIEANEFELQNFQTYEIKKNVDYSSKNKKIFSQLSLEEQQLVLKKSLEMVHMYYHQFKIVFNHYCRFVIENQHKRTFTFDDVSHSLQTLTLNRFMLFCREFDIIKTLQFKKKTEHNPSMSKKFLLKVYQKGAYLQRYMTFDSFLMTLVHISIKIHQNFDPRSYMHIQLFLNSLKVKYYQQFMKRLQSLSIKYSPTQFYNCYKHIFKRNVVKRKKQRKETIFDNPYFSKQQPNILAGYEDQGFKDTQNKLESRIRSYQSVPNLAQSSFIMNKSLNAKPSKTLHKKKVSVPILPSLQQNKYFKPIQPPHERTIFNKYLQKVEESSSVFKNRITGYSNINKLKTKGFHASQNPQSISKESLQSLLIKQKKNINNNIQGEQKQGKQNKIHSKINLCNEGNQLINTINESSNSPTIAKSLQKYQNKETFQNLKEKIDLRNNDQILKKHLISEQQNRQKELKGQIM